MSNNRILIIVTNGDEFINSGWKTGLWFSELTHFWDVAEQAGYSMDIASPSGGKIPIDPESLMISEMATAFGLEGSVSKHYGDRTFMDRLDVTMKVSDAKVTEYAAIYLAGGHGALFDSPKAVISRNSLLTSTRRTRSFLRFATDLAGCSTCGSAGATT